MFYIRTLYKAKGNDMYIPKANLTTDQDEIVAFMKEYSFATLITTRDNIPVASHLPFTISRRDSQLILSSHFAKANNQWQDIENHKILVIFSEPHAYISTKNYVYIYNYSYLWRWENHT